MWISPRTLASQWQDYTGTTPVDVPGTVADTSNPVGLALDIRAGATVLTDPGLHMLQSTSAARPLLSARVNLLQYTEDLSNAAWSTAGSGSTVTGTNVLNLSAEGQFIYQTAAFPGNVAVKTQAKLSGAGTVTLATFDSGTSAVTQVTLTSTPTIYTHGMTSHASCTAMGFQIIRAVGDTATSVTVTDCQLNYGSTALTYQRVGAASDYNASGFPIAQKYDGIDDSMATAAFAAGTLINGMDYMIAVRRDSSEQNISGLYQNDQTKYFGVVGEASGDDVTTYDGCGTPTIFVDGVAVANTRGALFDALTVGDFHILEYRGLDLSAWVDAAWGSYPTCNAARGDILLFPSTTPTADKDAARQWLADYYGVTLP